MTALTTALLTAGVGGLPEQRAEARLGDSEPVVQVSANRGNGPCTDHDWNGGPAKMRRAIRCVWRRFDPGEGGAAKAIAVASCESGLNPRAYGNGNGGLFQHRVTYWPGRFDRFIRDHNLRSSWGLSSSVYAGRTNAIVTSLMVRRSGWGAWSCA